MIDYFLFYGNMFALSVTSYKIFANQIKWQKFDNENEGQVEDGEKGAELVPFDLKYLESLSVIFHSPEYWLSGDTRQRIRQEADTFTHDGLRTAKDIGDGLKNDLCNGLVCLQIVHTIINETTKHCISLVAVGDSSSVIKTLAWTFLGHFGGLPS